MPKITLESPALPKPMATTVLVIDDHPIFLDGIVPLISSLFENSIVLVALSGAEAIKVVDVHPEIEWIFLDIKLPDINGLDLLTKFSERKILAPTLIVSGYDDIDLVDTAFEKGISAFLPKSASKNQFKLAIDEIDQNGFYCSSDMNQRLHDYRSQNKQTLNQIGSHLTKRQKEILILIKEGYSNGEIAEVLKISESTVKGHVSVLLTLLDVTNRTQWAAEATRRKMG